MGTGAIKVIVTKTAALLSVIKLYRELYLIIFQVFTVFVHPYGVVFGWSQAAGVSDKVLKICCT